MIVIFSWILRKRYCNSENPRKKAIYFNSNLSMFIMTTITLVAYIIFITYLECLALIDYYSYSFNSGLMYLIILHFWLKTVFTYYFRVQNKTFCSHSEMPFPQRCNMAAHRPLWPIAAAASVPDDKMEHVPAAPAVVVVEDLVG